MSSRGKSRLRFVARRLKEEKAEGAAEQRSDSVHPGLSASSSTPMGNTWVVDMRHYLDEETGDLPDSLPGRVLRLALCVGSIVVWVTDHLPEGDWHTNVRCRRDSNPRSGETCAWCLRENRGRTRNAEETRGRDKPFQRRVDDRALGRPLLSPLGGRGHPFAFVGRRVPGSRIVGPFSVSRCA